MAVIRSILCLAAALAGGAPASAESPSALNDFETAMAARDMHGAARHLDALVAERRPSDGKLRVDPLLSAAVGRFYLRSDQTLFARSYLEQARHGSLPDTLRVSALIALATAEEIAGDREAALATLKELGGLPLSDAERRAVRLAEARMVMVSDPLRAVAIARGVAGETSRPAERWEAELLEAEAHALAGDRPAAEAAADRAWASAAMAPAEAFAPLRVALQRGALAQERNDRDGLLAMLSVARASDVALKGDLANYLPICGTAGIRAEDHATFAAYTVAGAPSLVPVTASRPSIVAPFFDALAGRSVIEVADAMPAGTLFTVRCRTMPSDRFDFVERRDPWSDWFASRGLAFAFHFGPSLEDVNALAREIAAVAERHGDDSPWLIPLRLSLQEQMLARAAVEGDVQHWQVDELSSKAMAGMRALGGADGLVPSAQQEKEQRAASLATTPEAASAFFRQASRTYVDRSPDNLAYSFALQWFRNDKDLPMSQKKAVIEGLLSRFEAKKDDPRRVSLLMQLADIQDDGGDRKAAVATLRRAGLTGDLCVLRKEKPELQQGTIHDDDYPLDAMRYALEGPTVLEFVIGATGEVEAPRLLLSSPADIFDAVLLDRIRHFRYAPARASGKASGCSGWMQRVVWRLPEASTTGVPHFQDPSETGT